MRSTLVIILTLLFALPAVGQEDFPDSRGTDFWFTFMPNFHNNLDELPTDVALQQEHQLYIYIGSEVPTSGTITMTDEDGNVRVEPFTITDPTQMYEFRTFFLGYELRGFNPSGFLDYDNMQTEKPARQSFHVEADDDVSVYALNQGRLTSEAFLVLPTDALGDDYAVMAYTTDTRSFSPNGEPNGNTTPTQFAVVATEDNTVVEITPSTFTFRSNPGETQSVLLQKGQSYLVQGDPRVDPFADLTGTIVSASRPVAVFGGHQRAILPIEERGNLGSRDCLVEQMNPIRTWGKKAYVIPMAMSSDEVLIGDNLYRVVSAFDSTVVYVDGAEVTILNEGDFYEAPLRKAQEITTSRPSMVAMFKKTAGSPNVGDTRNGDPFMMLVPPPEQFMKSYRFVNIQAYEYFISGGQPVPFDDVYKEQWLNVVIPTVGINSLRLDGQAVSAGWQRIGTTDHSFAQIRMTDGVHSISADTLFGIYVYGYGAANSYGYIGGMAYRPLDVFPPRVRGTVACGVFTGVVTDSIRGDTRVSSVAVVPGTAVNTRFTLGTFAPPQAIVPFQVALVDPFQDGQVTITAVDGVQQRINAPITLPGFTIGFEGQGADPAPQTRQRVIPIGQNRCDTVTLENYGLFPHDVTILRTTGSGIVTEPALPVQIGPGEKVNVVICRTSDMAGIELDTLIIGDTCLERTIWAIEIDVRDDQIGPDITGNVDPCSTSVDVTIADDRPFDFGIESIRVMDEVLENCTVEARTTGVARSTFRIDILDPFFDAVYGFEAVDSAGNRSQTIDTIPGFTLAIDDEAGEFSSRRLPGVPLGEVVCETITLTNYGTRPQVIRDVIVAGNVRFSIPQHQFTITVPPGGSAPLTVCYEPVIADTVPDIDTLIFLHGCVDKQLEVRSNGAQVAYQGLTRCDVPLEVTVERLASPLLVMPQPADDALTIVLGDETEALMVRVVDLQGAEVLSATWSGAPTRSAQLDLSEIAAGTYGLFVRSDAGTSRTLIIVR